MRERERSKIHSGPLNELSCGLLSRCSTEFLKAQPVFQPEAQDPLMLVVRLVGINWWRLGRTGHGDLRAIGRRNVYLIRRERLDGEQLRTFNQLRFELGARLRLPNVFLSTPSVLVEERVRFGGTLNQLELETRVTHTWRLLESLGAPSSSSEGSGGGARQADRRGLVPSHGDLSAGNVVIDKEKRAVVLDNCAFGVSSYQSLFFDSLTLLLHVPDRSAESFAVGGLFFKGKFDSFFMLRAQGKRRSGSLTKEDREVLASTWATEFSAHSGWRLQDLEENLEKLRAAQTLGHLLP